ncbi:hypothetical protein AZE42_13325 [Rhizopogon vesiculosus]|uniref:Uncharacterized protein n=1 Tax=Rhizopogon vesiculosus TaxID=180088 RepID=A0A1J8QI51_9AGAM|nr:hypothetical protein AZE42_13325 [Rhizopogon vesiculosus]
MVRYGQYPQGHRKTDHKGQPAMWRRSIEPFPPTHLSTWDSSSTLAKTTVPPTPAS